MKDSKFKSTYNRIFHAVFTLLRRRNVSVRLGIGFILITVLPVLAVGFFSYARGSQAVYNKMSHSIIQTMEQVSVNLSYQLQAIINDDTEIAYSELVQSALINYDKLSGQEINNIETKLSDYINKKYIFSDRVAEITLYTLQLDRINAYGPSDFRFMPKKENLDRLIKRAGNLDGMCLWVAVGPEFEQGLASKMYKDRKSIIMARAVKSLQNGDRIGYILMRIDEEQFLNVYGKVNIGTGTQMFILNSENKVISSAGNYAKFSMPYTEPELLDQIRSSDQKSFNFKTSDRSYLAVFSTIKQADWYVVALVQFSYLYSESHHLLLNVLIIGLLCLLFALCMSFIIYRSILTPVRQLIFGINSFKNGKLDISIDDKGNDNGQCTINDDANAKTLQFMLDMIKEGTAITTPGGGFHTEEYYGFMSKGGAASMLEPLWYMGRFTDYMPELKGKMQIAPIPKWTDNDVAPVFGGTSTSITIQCKNQDLAKRFLYKAKISPEGAVQIWDVLGFDPLRWDIWNTDAMKKSNKYTDYFGSDIFDIVLKMKDSFYTTNITNEQFPLANQLVAKNVLFKALGDKSLTPAQALDEAAKEIKGASGK